MEDKQVEKIFDEIKEELTKRVMEKLNTEIDKKIADINAKMSIPQKNSLAEEQQKAIEYIKAKYLGDHTKTKVLSPGQSGAGGELVPTYLSSEILRLAGEYGVVRANARLWPIGGSQNIATVGEVYAQRTTLTGTVYATDPVTGTAVALSPEKITGIVAFSKSYLINPTIDVLSLLTSLAGEAISKKEDQWGLVGDANNEGILKGANVSEVVLPTGKTKYSDVTADDLLSAVSLLKGIARKRAKWAMSWSVFNALRGLKDEQGRYIVQEPVGNMPATIWGYPVLFSDVMPEVSESNQAGKPFIALGDFNYMILGQLQGLEMDISREATVKTGSSTFVSAFQDDLVLVKFTEFVDIKVSMPDKAFVRIKTASS